MELLPQHGPPVEDPVFESKVALTDVVTTEAKRSVMNLLARPSTSIEPIVFPTAYAAFVRALALHPYLYELSQHVVLLDLPEQVLRSRGAPEAGIRLCYNIQKVSTTLLADALSSEPDIAFTRPSVSVHLQSLIETFQAVDPHHPLLQHLMDTGGGRVSTVTRCTNPACGSLPVAYPQDVCFRIHVDRTIGLSDRLAMHTAATRPCSTCSIGGPYTLFDHALSTLILVVRRTSNATLLYDSDTIPLDIAGERVQYRVVARVREVEKGYLVEAKGAEQDTDSVLLILSRVAEL